MVRGMWGASLTKVAASPRLGNMMPDGALDRG
jgi:hypothetical protein